MVESTIPGIPIEETKQKIADELQKSDNISFEKDHYNVEDFLKYHDHLFVTALYRGVLRREPDTEGFANLLQLLRSGRRSELELLIAVRYSPEGKAKDVPIAGLDKRRFLATIYRLPVVGYFVRLLTITRYIQRINALRNGLFRLQDEADSLLFRYSRHIAQSDAETAALHNKLEETRAQLLSQIDTKADKFDIELRDSYEEIPPSYLTHAVEGFGRSAQERDALDQDDLYYLLFENVFYNHDAVKEKQKIYLPYIRERAASDLEWLDIGCGRGEFLDILKSHNIPAIGVEINTIEYTTLKDRGFEVFFGDAVSFLEAADRSFGGISALQVVEHLEYGYLKDMLHLAYRKIVPGGIIILETINPRNELGLANFYMDETHKRPLAAEMMAFLLEWVGFTDIRILYSALLSESYRRNKEIGNNYHDYAVIGYKR